MFCCKSVANTTVINSINKGNVSAKTYGYGITNNITVARNVVSMGDVNGSSGSHTFWDSFINVDLFYGLRDKCFNCSDDATLLQQNINTGFYEVVETGEHVHDLLNDESVNQHFGMVWSKELELVDKVTLTINVSGFLNGHLLVESGTQLGQVSNLTQFFDDKFIIMSGDSGTKVVYNSTSLVSRDMNVLIARRVTVSIGAPINSKKMFNPGVTLDEIARLFGFSLVDYIVVNSTNNQVLNPLSTIERDCVLRLCHKVSVSGIVNASLNIEHGTMFGQIDQLSSFFDPYHVVYNSSNATYMVKNDTLVLHDMSVVISNASKQVIVVSFDENVNATLDDIKDAIADIVPLPKDEHLWVEVFPQDDGSFVISVIQTNIETVDVGDVLTDCLSNNS